MKKFLTLFSVVALMMLLMSNSSCEQQQATDKKLSAQQEQSLAQADAQSGFPAMVNFQERKQLKMIIELRDRADIVNYCYCKSEVSGKYTFLGRCLGFPIPYATQYTSPQKIGYNSERGVLAMPQADPNGLYMPGAADATWVMMLDSAGTPTAGYFEDHLTVVQKPLRPSIVINQQDVK